jgi:hypothetical protein
VLRCSPALLLLLPWPLQAAQAVPSLMGSVSCLPALVLLPWVLQASHVLMSLVRPVLQPPWMLNAVPDLQSLLLRWAAARVLQRLRVRYAALCLPRWPELLCCSVPTVCLQHLPLPHLQQPGLQAVLLVVPKVLQRPTAMCGRRCWTGLPVQHQ